MNAAVLGNARAGSSTNMGRGRGAQGHRIEEWGGKGSWGQHASEQESEQNIQGSGDGGSGTSGLDKKGPGLGWKGVDRLKEVWGCLAPGGQERRRTICELQGMTPRQGLPDQEGRRLPCTVWARWFSHQLCSFCFQ